MPIFIGLKICYLYFVLVEIVVFTIRLMVGSAGTSDCRIHRQWTDSYEVPFISDSKLWTVLHY